MKTLRIFQVDAFSNQVFRGNPAAVCPLGEWLDSDTMQSIALENNLSETAFFVPGEMPLELRWFTPEYEVDLCGHATLASAFVIFTELDPSRDSVVFQTRSGPLEVKRSDGRLTMNFPTWTLQSCDDPPGQLLAGLGAEPAEVLRVQEADNFFAVFETQSQVATLRPDFGLLKQLHPCGVVATGPGEESDCVSRYFAPSYGIPEDPVTGSIHCGLIPYWARRLGKPDIYARQISNRGGELFCRLLDNRVEISGRAVKFLEGKIQVPG